jgi:hypothetical protein
MQENQLYKITSQNGIVHDQNSNIEMIHNHVLPPSKITIHFDFPRYTHFGMVYLEKIKTNSKLGWSE